MLFCDLKFLIEICSTTCYRIYNFNFNFNFIENMVVFCNPFTKPTRLVQKMQR